MRNVSTLTLRWLSSLRGFLSLSRPSSFRGFLSLRGFLRFNWLSGLRGLFSFRSFLSLYRLLSFRRLFGFCGLLWRSLSSWCFGGRRSSRGFRSSRRGI